jgi:hypothetical protein
MEDVIFDLIISVISALPVLIILRIIFEFIRSILFKEG